MPELPEVETVRIGLSKFLPGKTIKDVWFDTPKIFPNADADVEAFVIGAKIVLVARRAKVLLIELSTKYTLLIHLKMTGQLVFVGNPTKSSVVSRQSSVKSTGNRGQKTGDNLAGGEIRFGAGHPNDSLINNLPDKTTHVIFDFGDSKLFFNDQRKFGWVKLIPTAEVPSIDFFKKIGPEPLAADFTAEKFIERLEQRRKSGIKAVLLDQSVVAGIGNIYADESLFAAKIHPETKVQDIPAAKLKTLYTELIAVLKLSIEKGGSTDRNYVNAEGKKGSYIGFAKVFRKEGTPCKRCGTIIEKTRVAGRGTHICPACQPKL